ncbi:MAG: IPTL-CTERM sorting domain-containing protein [Acidobacteria bacterium]|nr:IPTL-CTERM sorting domain-containing protein [Acidobacteriota bacterium]
MNRREQDADTQIRRQLILLFVVPSLVAGVWAIAASGVSGHGFSEPSAVAQSGGSGQNVLAGSQTTSLRDDTSRRLGTEGTPVPDYRTAVDPSILVFEPRGGPQTARVTALAVDPTNAQIAYAGTATGEIYRTTDGGACWRRADSGIPSGAVTSLAIDPSNPKRIFAGVSVAGIFKSIDGGATWTLKQSSLLAFLWIAIAASNPSMVYAAGTTVPIVNNAWWKSTDGGETWAGATFPSTSSTIDLISTIAIDPSDPSTVYFGIGLAGGILKITAGVTWTKLNVGPAPNAVNALAINPANPTTLYAASLRGIFKSLDGGLNWAAANSGLPAGTIANSVALSPGNPSTIYAATSAGFAKSVDGGGNWTILSFLPGGTSLSLLLNPFRPLAVSPSTPQVIYAGSSAGILKSANGGASWIPANSGILAARIGDLVLDPKTSTVYAGTFGGGVFKSANGGARWNSLGSLDNPSVNALALDPADSGVLYAATEFGGVFKSINAGAAWTAVNSELPVGTMHFAALTIDPKSPQTVYAGALRINAPFDSGGGLFMSNNGGATWTSLSGLSPMSGITSILVDAADSNIVYVGTRGIVFGGPIGGTLTAASKVMKSTDGGLTWAQALLTSSSGRVLLVQNPSEANVIYAADGRFIRKSSDSGTTWTLASSGLPPFSSISDLDIDGLSPNILYATVELFEPPAVYKTINGGATWVPLGNTGLPSPPRSRVLALDPANPSRLYLGTLHRGVFRSDDGGTTWRPTGAPLITSLPRTAVPGSTVTITGSGFLDGCLQISIDGIPATEIHVLSDSIATFVVPYLIPGPADVVLSTSGGSVTLPAGPSGVVVVAAIPTLSDWGVALLAAVLLGAGIYILRRMRRQSGFPA